MKILFVTPDLPSPPRLGAQRRVDGLMRGLAKNHEISLLSFIGTARDPELALSTTGSYCKEIVTVPNDTLDVDLRQKRVQQLLSLFSPHSFEYHSMLRAEFQLRLDRMLAATPYDVVQVEFSELAIYRFARRTARRPCLVLDEHNIEYEIVKRTAETSKGFSRKLYSAVDWRKLRREERDAWKRFDGVLLTSARDEELLREDEPSTKATVIPNAVDLDGFRPSDTPPEPKTLLFFGAMNYHPNIDGIHYFVDEIFPKIKALDSEVVLRLVGQHPPASILAKHGNGVDVVGFVDDPRPLLDRAAILVVPLRIGGGTRFKIVEGMAKGKAIVSTRLGAEGLDVVHDEHLLLADDPAEFARQVQRLLVDPSLTARLGAAARRLAEERYGWDAAVSKLERFYDQLLAS